MGDRRAELGQVVVGDNDVFETQQRFGIEVGDLPCRLADHVTAQQDVADQSTGGGVFGARHARVEFNQFSDVVADGTGHDEDLESGGDNSGKAAR